MTPAEKTETFRLMDAFCNDNGFELVTFQWVSRVPTFSLWAMGTPITVQFCETPGKTLKLLSNAISKAKAGDLV